MSIELTDKIAEFAARFRDLTDKIEADEEALKILKEERKKLAEHTLPKLMEDGEIESIRLQGIGTLFLRTDVKVSVLVQDKPQFFDYLRKNGHGDIIKEDVHHKTLSSWGKEVLEGGYALPDFCKVFYQPTAILRRK